MAVNPRVVGGAATCVAALAMAIKISMAVLPGLEGDVHKAYPDIAGGPWTICRGHTKGVKKGDVATEAQCEQYARDDLADADAIIDRCITVSPDPHRRAALQLFALNEGAGANGVKDGLCTLKSGAQPYIRRMANAGRWQEACDGLLDWTTANGVRYAGLVKRRHIERAICLTPDFSNVTNQ